MQYAEAQGSFLMGYHHMIKKFCNDRPRLEFLKELFEDPMKAMWKKDLKFCNGLLVDICETLFSALKTWVQPGAAGASLLMAIVRIAEGCRRMVMRSFLKPLKTTFKKFVRSEDASQVKYLMSYCINHLTAWAISNMYSSLKKSWTWYEIKTTDAANSDVMVTSRYSDDVFVIHDNCQCWNNRKRCWQQLYRGLPCRHSLLATIERLRRCTEKDDKDKVCKILLGVCNSNWLRTTYSEIAPPTEMSEPPPVSMSTPPEFLMRNRHYTQRFQQVLRYLPASVIEKALNYLETSALHPPPCNELMNSDSSPLFTRPHTQEYDSQLLYSNPKRRYKRKKIQDNNIDSDS